MSENNPFAPLPDARRPAEDDANDLGIDLQADVHEPQRVYRWQSGVATSSGATWPPRCVVCNVPVPKADQPFRLRWQPTWAVLFYLVGGLPGILVASYTTHTVTVQVGLCGEHHAQHAQRRAFARNLGLAGFGFLAAAGLLARQPGLVYASLPIGLILWSIAAARARPLRISRMHGTHAVIQTGPTFAASLPPE